MEKSLSKQELLVFISIFIPSFLLFFGAMLTIATGFPIVSSVLSRHDAYTPQLPLSNNREEELIDVTAFQGTQLFPSLSDNGLLLYESPSQVPNKLLVPSIGATVPLVMSKSMDDADVQAALAGGVALYPNGILPGRPGNTFIAGHSSGEPWRGMYRFAFMHIDKLTKGNIIHIDYEGTRYTYTVLNKETITPTPDFRVASDRPVPTMTLMTCWPIWSNSQRILVYGELTNITKLTRDPASKVSS